MALNYDKLLQTSVVDLPHSYSDRDSMLYAISVGMGRDPVDAARQTKRYRYSCRDK